MMINVLMDMNMYQEKKLYLRNYRFPVLCDEQKMTGVILHKGSVVVEVV